MDEVDEKMKRSAHDRSGLSLTIAIAANSLRIVHISRTLLSQRNLMFADSQPLRARDNIACLLSLAMTSVGMYVSGIELVRRAKDGQSLLSIESNEKVDSASAVSNAVSIGLCIAEVKNGRTLIKKRQYSTYGRIYTALTGSVSAAQFVLRLVTMR